MEIWLQSFKPLVLTSLYDAWQLTFEPPIFSVWPSPATCGSLCNKWLILFSAHTTPPILRLKSGKSASSSNSASQVRRKHQIQILELSGFSIKSCRQQTLIGRHSGKNMGKGASSSSSERVIATSVSTFLKGKSNTCPAGRLPKSV